MVVGAFVSKAHSESLSTQLRNYSWKGLLGGGYPPGYLDDLGAWTADQAQREPF